MEEPKPPANLQVSALVVVRSPEARLFEAALASLLAQDIAGLEIVIVETPGEPPVAPLVAARADARLRLVRAPVDTSLARARDLAVREARAPLVAWLDADDVALPGRLAKQAAFLDAYADVAVVGSWLELIDEKGRTLGYRCYPTDDATIRAALPRFNPIPQPGVMVRRDALLAAGGYVERPDGVCEDYDLWCRLERSGARFANLPEPLTRYRIHLGAMKARKLRGTLRDSIRIKRRYYGGALGARGRLRLIGESALCLLPPRLVLRIFLALEARRTLPPAALSTPPLRAPDR